MPNIVFISFTINLYISDIKFIKKFYFLFQLINLGQGVVYVED